jgi:hypothetical protein
MPLIFDVVVEVIPITVVFPRGTVLSDAPSRNVLSQMAIWTSRRCSFTSGMPCPIIVADERFPLGNAGRLLCDDEVHRLSPLLSQNSKGRATRCHPLDGLHNSSDLHGIEVRIQIPIQAHTQSSGI